MSIMQGFSKIVMISQVLKMWNLKNILFFQDKYFSDY